MKKKRILSLILAVMMVFTLFAEHLPISFADSGRELTQNDITAFDVAFYEDGNKLTELTKTVQVAQDFPGKIYTGLYIKVDLSGVSADTASQRLKAGDVLRISIPSNVSLSNNTFKTPDVMMGDTKIGTVAVDLAPGKHDVVVTFADGVNALNNVYVELTFRSGVTVNSKEQDIHFNILGVEKILRIHATKNVADSGHILLKDTGNTRTSGDYGYFTYVLYVNRAGESFNKITIKDRLENTTTNSGFDWDNVVFEKSTFKIEEAPSYDPTQILTLKSMSHEYRTDDSGVLKQYKGDSATANVPELAFDNPDKPKSFDINISNTGTKGFKIIYELRVPIDDVNKGFTVKNIASIVKTDTDEVLNPNRKDGKKNELNQNLSIVGSASGGGNQVGRVLIMKRDANENGSDAKGKLISGATFKLKHSDGTETAEMSTVEGRALFKKLKLGTYEVIEVSAPVDYETVSNKKVGDVTINNAGEVIIKEITNPRKFIDIKVTKKWAEGAAPKDVTFTLQRRVDEAESPTDFLQAGVDSLKTLTVASASDSVTFSGLYEYDGKGKRYIYTVAEKEITGYDSVTPVDVKPDGTNSVYQVEFTNKKTVIPKGSITIRKYITGTTTPIQGVEFTVGKKGDMGAPTKDMTDSDGTIVIKNLDMGNYEIKEISAPKGYKLNTASKEVTLQNADGKRDIVENFYNEKVLGSVKIKKLDTSTKKELGGAIFQVMKKETTGNTPVDTVTTDNNGVATVGNLELGEYIVKEIKAPKGYTLNEKTQKFEIKDENVVELTFENEKTPIPHPPSDEPTPEVEKPTPPTPKDPPKKEEPKKEEPKPEPPKEEPQPPADGIGGTGEPTPPTPTDDPIEGLTGGGAGGGTNDTNVLPGMIPGLSGGGSTAGGPNSAVDPGYVGRLPKTGEGLNSSAYALFFGLVGMSFVIYGAYKRRAKKQ